MTTKSTFLGHMIHRTAAGALCLGFGALFFSAIGVAGCGDDEGEGTGGSGQGGSGGIICEGGIVDEDGNCIAKCDPAKCVANNVCADAGACGARGADGGASGGGGGARREIAHCGNSAEISMSWRMGEIAHWLPSPRTRQPAVEGPQRRGWARR